MILHHALDKYIHNEAKAPYISYDLPDSRRVRGVEDLSHQHGLDRVPHNPGGRVGLQFFHQIIAERSCRQWLYIIYLIHSIKRQYGKWILAVVLIHIHNVPYLSRRRLDGGQKENKQLCKNTNSHPSWKNSEKGKKVCSYMRHFRRGPEYMSHNRI